MIKKYVLSSSICFSTPIHHIFFSFISYSLQMTRIIQLRLQKRSPLPI